jgi:hypothetical protein
MDLEMPSSSAALSIVLAVLAEVRVEVLDDVEDVRRLCYPDGRYRT